MFLSLPSSLLLPHPVIPFYKFSNFAPHPTLTLLSFVSKTFKRVVNIQIILRVIIKIKYYEFCLHYVLPGSFASSIQWVFLFGVHLLWFIITSAILLNIVNRLWIEQVMWLCCPKIHFLKKSGKDLVHFKIQDFHFKVKCW